MASVNPLAALRSLEPTASTVLFTAVLLAVTNAVGGLCYWGNPTPNGFYFATLMVFIIAWLLLWLDDSAKRRMTSCIGAVAFFQAWVFVLSPPWEVAPWVDRGLVEIAALCAVVFGAGLASKSPRYLANDIER